MRVIKTIAAGAALALLGAGCSGDDGGREARSERRLPDVQLASSLRRFDSCDAVRAWARDELAPRVGAYGFPGGGYWLAAGGVAEDTALAAEGDDGAQSQRSATPVPTATATESAEPDAFSGTNVQVEGVDEPDIVKTDGKRIISIVDGRLHLASAADARLLDSVELPVEMYDAELLLAGDRLLVFGNASFSPEIMGDVATSLPAPQLAGTRVVQVDIAEDSLRVGETYLLDGSYVSARMTGDVARLVLHADPQQRLAFVTPAVPTEDATARAQQMNRDLVEQASADDFLPKWRVVDEQGTVADEGALLDCEDAHAPNTFSGFGMVTVVSFDVSDGLASGIASSRASGVMAGGQTVYASPDHLYVAAPAWVDWEALSQRQLRVASERHGTDIHRFDISDPAEARYEISGHVEGELLNQFAMDEHDGNLRVATTVGSPWLEGEGESESQVVVLAPGTDALEAVGTVGGLGRGETIRSVRFIGDIGYVVTFEQTDPLYTIDLTDAANPRVTGELKILGYSAYLHPIGDGRLIGVGQDATEEGRTTGLQVALFDVRDPAAPARVAQATLPNANSGAEWDHRAFLWWAESGLVAVPVSSYEPPFEGLAGFTVEPDAGTISERGRVSHPTVGFDESIGGVPVPLPIDPDFAPDAAVDSSFRFVPPIMRSLVIGDQLWTLSSAGLAASELVSLGQTSFVPFG